MKMLSHMRLKHGQKQVKTAFCYFLEGKARFFGPTSGENSPHKQSDSRGRQAL